MKSVIKVLVVDDDEDDFIIARDLFDEIDRDRYFIEWADNYDEGLKVMSQCRHDVFLVDYRLGGASGLDLLREAQSGGCNAPIILLTGQGEHEIDTEAMRAGAEDFLVKGQITAKALERSVRYAIERKASEQEIQKLAAFPRCNPSPVLEFDQSGAMTYWNEAAQELAASLGKDSLASILPPDMQELVSDCLLTGVTRNVHTSLDSRTFSWKFVPIPASRVVHAYATEITERLNLEAQLRHSVKMDAVGQLAAGVAHDFNNILTVIQGHANLMLVDPHLDPDSEKALQQICSSAERASNLIRQLLMFSSKQVMQPRFLDLNEVINNVMRMLQRVLGEHISLKCQNAPQLPPIYADIGMMEQVLLNLVINARDAMPRGGTLTISTAEECFGPDIQADNPKARPGHFVRLSVRDTGTGIAPAIINRIFEPFFTTKEVGKGTGLGLATVYGILKQHEGWIDVESQLNVGTTFNLYYPCAVKTVEKSAKESASGSVVRKGTETILVVEDEPALRDLVVNILTLYGYGVYSAASGPEALQLWNKHRDEIAMLLTDMVMPEGMTGRELAEKLLQDNPKLKVIYTSGYSPGMAGKDIAMLDGFNFLPKPYPPTKLAQLVRECLDDSNGIVRMHRSG